jgi:hypothetical protein
VGVVFVFVATLRCVRRGRATLEVEYWINPLYNVSVRNLAYPDFYYLFSFCGVPIIQLLKERATLTEREQLPRILGYGHLEAGVSTSGMEVAASADLLAAAAAVAGPSVRGRPLFSLHSEESLVSSSADEDTNGGLTDNDGHSVASLPTYESFEMRPLKQTVRFCLPAILPVGPSETVNL